jgi:hypothetical protein
MSKHNKDNQKLEGMLRRWGAQEAAAKVQPRFFKSGGETLRVVIRWGAIAAAAAAVLAVAVYLGSLSGSKAPDDIELQDKLVKAEDDRDKYFSQLQENEKLLQDRTTLAEKALADLRKLQDRHSVPDPQIAELERRVKNLQRNLDLEKEQQRLTLAALTIAQKAAKTPASNPDMTAPPPRDVAALQDKVIRLEAQVGNYEDRLAVATNELARLKRVNDDWAKKAQKAQDELEAVKLAAGREFEHAQAAYLTTAAPAEHGLKARQAASKRARIVKRIIDLRRGDQPQAVVPVLNRMEVALTRLEMIDTNDTRAVQGLLKLLDNGGLVKQIDQAMAVNRATPELLDVLAEAKMILAGAENVS